MIIKFNKFPKVSIYSLLHYLRRILRNNNIEISLLYQTSIEKKILITDKEKRLYPTICEKYNYLLIVAENTLLAIPSESVPPQTIVQPPPYIAPPKPDDRQKSQKRYQDILKDSQPPNLRTYPENEKQPIADQKQSYTQEIRDSRQNDQLHDNRGNLFDQQRMPKNYEYQQQIRNYQTVHMHNARNQQQCAPIRDIDQQFFTLPTRRPQREVEPPRSVTPDITRGLRHGSLSSMHMLAKQGQQRITTAENEQRRIDHVNVGSRNLEQAETKGKFVQNQLQSIVDVRNR